MRGSRRPQCKKRQLVCGKQYVGIDHASKGSQEYRMKIGVPHEQKCIK
jgi:hypothetical protein